ncbi:hypothetical protein, conserved in T. vivax, (fragment), partial [Trypanosoma vivax Y486]
MPAVRLKGVVCWRRCARVGMSTAFCGSVGFGHSQKQKRCSRRHASARPSRSCFTFLFKRKRMYTVFRRFFLCAAAWCVLCLATPRCRATCKNVGSLELAIDCQEKLEDKKYQINQTKLFGHYNFSCFKENGETRVGLSVEGTELKKQLSWLGGSSAWCRYDGKVDNQNFNCTARRPRSLAHVPKDACTLYVQNDGALWFSTKVDGAKNVTCITSGLYGQLQFSFKGVEGSDDGSPTNITLDVATYANEPFISGFNVSYLPDAKHFPHLQTQNSHTHPERKNELKPNTNGANSGSTRPGASLNPTHPSKQGVSHRPVAHAKPAFTANPSDKPTGIRNEKQGDASESAARPEGEGKRPYKTHGPSASKKGTEAEASRGHANAAVALSLPMLIVHSFAA